MDYKFILAGGAVRTHVQGKRNHGDWDFFYVGSVSEADATLEKAVKYVFEHSVSKYNLVSRSKYVTTARCIFPGTDELKLQFIHRVYSSVDEVLGGFDLAHSAFAFTGTDLCTTPLGLWCLANKVEIVNLSRRSTSYENRLRKYAKRYELTLLYPGLDPATVDPIEPTRIGDYMQLRPCRGFNREGNTKWSMQVMADGASKGEPCDYLQTTPGVLSEYMSAHDTKDLLSMSNTRLILREQQSCTDSVAAMVYENGMVVLSVSYPEEDYIKMHLGIKAVPAARYTYSQRSAPRKMSVALHCEYTRDLFTAKSDTVGYDIIKRKMRLLLAQKAKELNAERQTVHWITENPGRQWTSSINPVIEDPKQFYRLHYQSFKIGVPEYIYVLLCLGRKDTNSTLSILTPDAVRLIMNALYNIYAQMGLQCCLGRHVNLNNFPSPL